MMTDEPGTEQVPAVIEMLQATCPPDASVLVMVVDPTIGVQYFMQNMDAITLGGFLQLMRISNDASFIDTLARQAQEAKSKGLVAARTLPFDNRAGRRSTRRGN